MCKLKTYCYRNFLLLLLTLFLGILPSFAKGKNVKVDGYFKFVVSEKNLYEGQPVIVDLLYVGSQKDIAALNRQTYPDFGGLKWRETSVNSRERDFSKGKGDMESAIMARYIIEPERAGEYVINPGEILADVYTDETFVDPFWGATYREKVRVPVESKETKLKVSKLPADVTEKKMPVGDYDLEWILPPGEIVPGQEGIVILKVTGFGDFSGYSWDNIPNAFGEGLKFIGMSPDVNVGLKDGRIFSTANFICTFSALNEGSYMLNPIKVEYFSPSSKKRISKSVSPIKIEINKSKKAQRPLRYEEI